MVPVAESVLRINERLGVRGLLERGNWWQYKRSHTIAVQKDCTHTKQQPGSFPGCEARFENQAHMGTRREQWVWARGPVRGGCGHGGSRMVCAAATGGMGLRAGLTGGSCRTCAREQHQSFPVVAGYIDWETTTRLTVSPIHIGAARRRYLHLYTG